MFEKEKYTSKNSKPITFTQKDLLKIGFSKKMIKTLLPEPELKPNPHYLSASPMREYKAEDVFAAMATKEFASMAEEHRKRSESASAAAEKAAATKEKKLADHAKEIVSGLKVPSVDEKELLIRALENQVNLYYEKDWQMTASKNAGDCQGKYRNYANGVYRADDKTKKDGCSTTFCTLIWITRGSKDRMPASKTGEEPSASFVKPITGKLRKPIHISPPLAQAGLSVRFVRREETAGKTHPL